jgi:hypothetical protein
MAKINLSYVVALIAGAVVAMSYRYFEVSAENVRIRVETYSHQQAADTLQAELINKREQIRLQQDKLAKGSAISDTIGPAVISDIQAAAEKNKNQRLRELLIKRTPRESSEQIPQKTPGTGPVK